MQNRRFRGSHRHHADIYFHRAGLIFCRILFCHCPAFFSPDEAKQPYQRTAGWRRFSAMEVIKEELWLLPISVMIA